MNSSKTPVFNGVYKEVWFNLLTEEEREEMEHCQSNSSKSSPDNTSCMICTIISLITPE